MPKQEHAGWTWANRFEYGWSLVEKFAGWIGGVILTLAGPAGHAIGGLTAIYYVIPLTGLGVFFFLMAYRRRFRTMPPVITEPVRREYTRERIDIVRLATRYGGALRDMTFLECEIFGPAVFCGGGGSITNYEPHLHIGDATSAFVEMPERGTRPDGMIGVSDCVFRRCHFYSITWALPRHILDEMRKELGILDKPKETAALPLPTKS